jgi:hypothetical protein
MAYVSAYGDGFSSSISEPYFGASPAPGKAFVRGGCERRGGAGWGRGSGHGVLYGASGFPGGVLPAGRARL